MRGLWLLLGGICLIACGDDGEGTGGSGGSEPESCVSDPWSCPAGQTCWANTDQQTFSCLNSGPGDVGDECLSVAGSPGCKDDLFCLQLVGQTSGTCTEFCDAKDPSHTCPDNRQCLPVQLAGSLLHACAPPEGSGAGGSGAGGSGGAGTGGSGG